VIKTIKDDRIDWFINFIQLDEVLLGFDPIIAGGSMLSLYRALKLHDTDLKWMALKRFLKLNPKNAMIDPFGDIDIWFQSENPIHNSDHDYHWLIADKADQASKHFPVWQFDTKADQASFDTKTFPGLAIGLDSFCKASGWANSFRSMNRKKLQPIYGGEIQFIKTPVTSVDELLSSFDFVNCSVAWRNGVLYYDDRIDDAFANFELRVNSHEPFKRSSIAMKVFGALRSYKYSDRYGIDFGPELTDYIFKLYVDSKNINYEEYGNKIIELETIYGKKISSINTLKSMVTHFHSLFEKFSNMKYFKKEYALYLVDYAEKFKGLKELLGEEKKDKGKIYSKFSIKPMTPHLQACIASLK
jgi:hypothetical protein